jgi:uncharacterized repeat protein (TIGR01451 family)
MAQSATTAITVACPTSPCFTAAGDKIDYHYTVTNTGTTTLSDVAVSDSFINPNEMTATPQINATCPGTPLAPTASEVCTYTYTVTQADVDSGQAVADGIPSVQNNATTGDGATAQNPSGATVDQTNALQPLNVDGTGANAACGAADPQTCISISETSMPPTFTAASQTLNFSYVVTNTGDISVTSVGVSSTLVPAATCAPDTLAPGQSETCTGSYTTTAGDVTAGSVTDDPTATANDVDYGNGYSVSTTLKVLIGT